MGFKNTITPQAGWEGITQAAIGTISLFQARQARIDYGNKVSEIETKLSNRQDITNPYQNLENPYKNLSVATQAARIQAEEADIALANTLDTLRATGKSAGGATALAQAALRSKKDISASIEQQEVNNEKLKAQGQLQVDIARGKGEVQRMMLQEQRTEADLGRLQDQADLLQAQQFASRSAAAQAFGAAGKAIAGGIVPKKKDQISNVDNTAVNLTDDELNKKYNAGRALDNINRNTEFSLMDESGMPTFQEDPMANQQSYVPGGTALSMFPNKGVMPVVGVLNNSINRSAYSNEELESILGMQRDNPTMQIDEILTLLSLD